MNVLLGAPIATAILLAIIVILLYLYKTSELLNKRSLRIGIILAAVIAIAVNLILIPLNRQPSLDFRLAVLPFTADAKLPPDSDWLKTALPEMIGATLHEHYQPDAVVGSLEWTYPVIALDSLADQAYLQKIFKRVPYSHFLTGHITSHDEHIKIQTTLYDKHAVGIDFEIDTNFTDLVTATQALIGQLSDHLPGKQSCKSLLPDFQTSLPALQAYFSGLKLFLDSQYADARDCLLASEKSIAEFPLARLLLARCHFQLGLKQRIRKSDGSTAHFAPVQTILENILRKHPNMADAHRLLGEYYIYSKRWSLAEHHLVQSYKMDPLNYRLYLPISRLNRERFEALGFQSEQALFERAIHYNPCYTDGYLSISDIQLFESKREQAIETLNTFLEIHPTSVSALMALGKIYIVRNEMHHIMDILTRVIKLAPDYSDAYYNLGILYYNSEDITNAKRFFQKAIEIDNHLNSHLYLAYIYELEGDMDSALTHLRLRIHHKTGPDDQFAEEARRHLYKIMHPKAGDDK